MEGNKSGLLTSTRTAGSGKPRRLIYDVNYKTARSGTTSNQMHLFLLEVQICTHTSGFLGYPIFPLRCNYTKTDSWGFNIGTCCGTSARWLDGVWVWGRRGEKVVMDTAADMKVKSSMTRVPGSVHVISVHYVKSTAAFLYIYCPWHTLIKQSWSKAPPMLVEGFIGVFFRRK